MRSHMSIHSAAPSSLLPGVFGHDLAGVALSFEVALFTFAHLYLLLISLLLMNILPVSSDQLLAAAGQVVRRHLVLHIHSGHVALSHQRLAPLHYLVAPVAFRAPWALNFASFV